MPHLPTTWKERKEADLECQRRVKTDPLAMSEN